MVYAGIDYSLNCPCVCIYDDSIGSLSHETCQYFFSQKGVSKREIERRRLLNLPNIHPSVQYDWKDNTSRYIGLADWFLSILVQYGVEKVAMENYALGAMGRVFNIAECTQTLKIFMRMVGIDFVIFPPTYVKKVFSGSGNADKDVMSKAYTEKYGVSISELMGKKELTDSPISDIVDSHAMLYTFFNGDATIAESV